ncbi:hypothetical protein LK996_10430 [Lysobacter sp. A6]|uniref:Uncharacterized protein n=1 Tax=Noviluteimonas lactosilytica TaxID=2888523 RepID=A0ABS8JIX4_9GAMM|nr:hypothetical protein [Lysobacter lactosilyticus]MCC8363489.1 hypothetical protein [Lysobacter lactosilyticus]
MIEIEFEPPVVDRCECCGKDTVRLTRFVYKDGDAHAVYYAQFSRSHDSGRINGLVGLGEWGESDTATPENRVAFPFELWASDASYNVALVDAAESPWSHVTFLGRILDRAEALAHPLCREVFHLTDHMVTDDAEVKAFLDGASPTGDLH